MKIYEAMYLYIMNPKEAIKRSVNFEYSLLIYLITSLSIAISILYSIDSESNALNLLILSFGIASYVAASNIAKVGIINLVVSIFFKNNDKKNLTVFINNCFGIYGVFILLLPITLLCGRFSSLIFIQIAVFFILQLYYIILVYKNIVYSFGINNSFKTVLVLIAPIICDYLIYISLIILTFGSFISII